MRHSSFLPTRILSCLWFAVQVLRESRTLTGGADGLVSNSDSSASIITCISARATTCVCGSCFKHPQQTPRVVIDRDVGWQDLAGCGPVQDLLCQPITLSGAFMCRNDRMETSQSSIKRNHGFIVERKHLSYSRSAPVDGVQYQLLLTFYWSLT